MAIFPKPGVVAFQPSATSEVFSAWHFLLLRVLLSLVAVWERAGDEQADVGTAELLVVGALMEQPGCSTSGARWMLGTIRSAFSSLAFC